MRSSTRPALGSAGSTALLAFTFFLAACSGGAEAERPAGGAPATAPGTSQPPPAGGTGQPAPPGGLAPPPGQEPQPMVGGFEIEPGHEGHDHGPYIRVPEAERVDEKMVVATVNGEEIRGDKFNRALVASYRGFVGKGVSIDQQSLKAQLLNAMIESELLRQAAEKKGLGADQTAVDEEYQKYMSGAGSTEQFQQTLQQAGVSVEELKRDIREKLTVEKYVKVLSDGKVNVPDVPEAEARAFYDANQEKLERQEMVRARQILRRVPNNATEAQRREELAKIEEALEKIKAGADFAQIARTYSSDTTATRGGDLGFFPRGVMVPPFEEAAFKLEPGEVSDIVESRIGFHLIKSEMKIPGGIPPYDEVRDDIRKILRDKKAEQAQSALVSAELDKLRSQAKIEVFLKPAAQAAGGEGVG